MEDQSQSILEDKVNAMIINSFYWNSMIVYSRDILTNMILLNYILIYVCIIMYIKAKYYINRLYGNNYENRTLYFIRSAAHNNIIKYNMCC